MSEQPQGDPLDQMIGGERQNNSEQEQNDQQPENQDSGQDQSAETQFPSQTWDDAQPKEQDESGTDEDQIDPDQDTDFDVPRGSNESLFTWSDVANITQFVVNFHKASKDDRELFAELIAYEGANGYDIAREVYPTAGRVESLYLVKRIKETSASGNFTEIMGLGVELSNMDDDDIRSISRLINSLYRLYHKDEEMYPEFRYRRNMDFNKVIQSLTQLVMDISDEGFQQIDWMIDQLKIWPGRA